MFILQITAFIILLLWIAWYFKENLITVIPIGTCLLILGLYTLAFFRGLFLSDYIAIGILITTLAVIVKTSKENRHIFLQFARGQLLAPEVLTAFCMLVVVTACVSSKVTSWWDDYNFWATDVKSLYYLNGFAGKYANVAAEFGDYPPGTQLFKWWFLHFSPNQFKEGLMFGGYHVMNLIFMLPLLKQIKHKNVLTMLGGAAMLWLFPAVAEVFWCDGTCADLTMALVYGAFLVAVVDRPEWNELTHNSLFYYGRQALLLMILVLCKNTGFLWVGMGLAFSWGYQALLHRQAKADKKQRKAERISLLAVTMMPILTEVSWLLFCLINRRVAKLTGTALHMVTGSIQLPAYQKEMANAFAEAFVKWPIHRWKTIGIDLTPLACYLLILLFVILLFMGKMLDRQKALFTGVFFTASGVLFYALNLFSHLTIFAVETQYLEPFGMVSSIERYGAPFVIGGFFLLGYLYLNNAKTDRSLLICLLFVLLTTDLNSTWRALYGYRELTEGQLEERAEIIDEQAEIFLEVIGAGEAGNDGRVLYLRDISDVSWVRNAYIGFEAVPVSVMYGNVDTKSVSSQDIQTSIKDAHATYLYVDELRGDGQTLFEPFVEEPIEYGCLYQVNTDGQGMKLIKYSR